MKVKILEKEKKQKKQYLVRKYILSAIILFFLFGYSSINLYINYDLYQTDIEKEIKKGIEGKKKPIEVISGIENALTDDIWKKMNYLEIYSYVHVLLGKEEIKNFSYIKDKNGNMNYAAFYSDRDENIFKYALQVRKLQDATEAKGTKVMFVIPPSKYNEKECEYSTGLPVNKTDGLVDELMFYLNRLEITTLNYAEYMPNEELPYEELFYKTDHHWTVKASYNATKLLVDKINSEYGLKLDGSYYLDENNITKKIYPKAMFGSMGRGAGACFAGVEDYEAYYPNWEMQFTKETMMSDGTVEISEGGYEDTLIDNSVLEEKNLYKNWAYSLYLSGIRPYEHIINHDNPDGAKILMIRDSYFSPVITFLAPMVSQIDAIWTMEGCQVNIEDKIAEEDYDLIIVEVYPYNINENAFYFFETAGNE